LTLSNFPINVPNTLTICRILLTPLFVIFLLKTDYTSSLIVFACAGISDGLDGFIARYADQRTLLGAFLDPIADKLLLMSGFVCLAVLGLIPTWLAVVILTRDVVILLGVAIFGIFNIRFDINPSVISKFTTFSQISLILIILIEPVLAFTVPLRNAWMAITAAVTIVSGLHYIYVGMLLLQDTLEEKP
jgi:cardiolipin synthase